METRSVYKTYYYSGGQAQIYYDDVFLDEISSLTFSTVTNKTPLYGYSSTYFDTVAKGNILIQGNFVINFVNSNYLSIIAESIRQRKELQQSIDENGLLVRPNPVLENLGAVLGNKMTAFQTQQAINQIRGLGNREFARLADEIARGQSPVNYADDKFYSLKPFEIFAVFGDETDPKANHTARKIKEVYLTGQAQVVNSSGEVIQEQYSFIARDIGDIE